MGWWSPTIMGGDLPLNYHRNIIMQIGGDLHNYYKDNSGKLGLTKEMVEQNLDKLINDPNYTPNSSHVYFQVVAVAVLVTGSEISDENMKILLKHCVDIDLDDWDDPDKRQKYLNDLKTALEEHIPGQQNLPNQEGLFSIMGKKLTEGKKNLPTPDEN